MLLVKEALYNNGVHVEGGVADMKSRGNIEVEKKTQN